MLAAIVGDTMHFQTISSRGETIDEGTVRRVEPPKAVPTGTTGVKSGNKGP